MVVMGTILEAVLPVLESQIDFTCIGSPNKDPKPGIRPIWSSCNKKALADNLFLNEEKGTLCRTKGVCLASKNNSDEDGSEIVEIAETNNKGGFWQFRNLKLVNGFGLCLQRDVEKEQLIQKKCDESRKPCNALPNGQRLPGNRPIRLLCSLNTYSNAFLFNEATGTICRIPGVCLASKNDSDRDRAEMVQTAVTTEKSGLWKFTDGYFVNGFGFCLERDLDDSPSQLVQAQCNPDNYWQKFNLNQ
jgi:hypothetical protein